MAEEFNVAVIMTNQGVPPQLPARLVLTGSLSQFNRTPARMLVSSPHIRAESAADQVQQCLRPPRLSRCVHFRLRVMLSRSLSFYSPLEDTCFLTLPPCAVSRTSIS